MVIKLKQLKLQYIITLLKRHTKIFDVFICTFTADKFKIKNPMVNSMVKQPYFYVIFKFLNLNEEELPRNFSN